MRGSDFYWHCLQGTWSSTQKHTSLGGISDLNKKSRSSITHHNTFYAESPDGQPAVSSSVQSTGREKCHSIGKGSKVLTGTWGFAASIQTWKQVCLLLVRVEVAPVISEPNAWYGEKCGSGVDGRGTVSHNNNARSTSGETLP